MNAAILVIGTEITKGIIEDKNTSVIAKELTHLGMHVSSSVALPDDGSVEETLSSLIGKIDCVILSGGLGPTSDDMTRSSIAEAAKRKLVRNEEAWSHLVSSLGERAYGANSRQSFIPEGFSLIENPLGTAPGFWGEEKDTLIVSMPGPPKEMQGMLYSSVVPLLRKRIGIPEEERDEYSSFLTPEARLEEMTEAADPTLLWATRFQVSKISLYVSGKTRRERDEAIAKMRTEAGEGRIEDGETDPLSLLSSLLVERGETISAAESCTGGLCSSLLTSLPGSSRYMAGSVVSYAVSVKERVLGVREGTIRDKGAVSVETALEMAEGVLSLVSSDWALSVTGVAGPDKTEGKDVGTVCFGFAGKGRKSQSARLRFGSSLSRSSIRRRSSQAAFILMRFFIEGKDAEAIASGWRDLS